MENSFAYRLKNSWRSNRTLIWYAILFGGLVVVMKLVEYSFWAKSLPFEFYIAIVALLCTVLGVWSGLRWTKKKQEPIIGPGPGPFRLVSGEELGISKRELDVLQGMAAGLSNQEIADRLFVSLNTIKSHSANLYVKLDVKRRTQAVARAKELKIID